MVHIMSVDGDLEYAEQRHAVERCMKDGEWDDGVDENQNSNLAPNMLQWDDASSEKDTFQWRRVWERINRFRRMHGKRVCWIWF